MHACSFHLSVAKKEAARECRYHKKVETYCLTAAELVCLDAFPTEIVIEQDAELRKIDKFYAVSLSTKRKHRTLLQIECKKKELIEMFPEFGPPDKLHETFEELRKKLLSALRHRLHSKALTIESLTYNARKLSGSFLTCLVL